MSDTKTTTKEARHKRAMEKQKAAVDSSIEAADIERGVALLLTGDGKGQEQLSLRHGATGHGVRHEGWCRAIY